MTVANPDSTDRRVLPSEVDAGLVDDISNLVAAESQAMVMNMVADLYPVDIASLLHHLSLDHARQLFGWLPAETASDVVPELDDDFRAAVLEVYPTQHISEILDDMESDEVADVLADLPTEIAQDVLVELEDSIEVQALLGYPEDTAGGIMGTDFVSVNQEMTVGEVTEEVRRSVDRVDPIFAVYVVDATGLLVGVASLKKLLLSRANVLVNEIMDPNVISVTPEVDQEEVARIIERYDLVAIPVVGTENQLVGRITIDDIVDVIREEAEEDIQKMSGVRNEEMTSSILQMTRGRLAWLFLGLIGATLSGLVINEFEDELTKAVVLAMFIPVVMAMAGNAGIQSSAVAVQGLASGDLWSTDIAKRLSKELAVALINGVALSVGISLLVLLLGQTGMIDTPELGMLVLTVALTLLTVIVLAATVGATVPLVLDRFEIDPALATGPFITTSNDLLGLVVYFLIASALFL